MRGHVRCVHESLVRDRVKTRNRIHGVLLEFGINLEVGLAVITHFCAAVAEHRLTFQGPTHQFSSRGPSAAPASVGISMPRRYQTAQNGTPISGQWKQ